MTGSADLYGDTETLRYVCEECGLAGPLPRLNDDCKPGWTHGRLVQIMSDPELDRLRTQLAAAQTEIEWLTDQVERFRAELGLPPL